MNDQKRAPESENDEQGLFKRFPNLSILIIAFVAYGLLIGMCAVVGVLLIRG